MTHVVVLALAAALIYAVVKMKAGARWGRPATIVVAVLIISFTVVRWSCRRRSEPRVDPAAALGFEQTSARMLADALGKHMRRGSTTVVFALGVEPDSHEAMVAGLEEGFEPHEITVAAVLPPIPLSEANPKKQREEFDAALAKHPDAGGVIIYGDPAADMEGLEASGNKKLRLGIMAQRLTPLQALQRVKERTATVVIVPRPGVNWAKVTRTEDPERRFRKTYLLITPDSVDEIEKTLR
jgi:hypothetical protein